MYKYKQNLLKEKSLQYFNFLLEFDKSRNNFQQWLTITVHGATHHTQHTMVAIAATAATVGSESINFN